MYNDSFFTATIIVLFRCSSISCRDNFDSLIGLTTDQLTVRFLFSQNALGKHHWKKRGLFLGISRLGREKGGVWTFARMVWGPYLEIQVQIRICMFLGGSEPLPVWFQRISCSMFLMKLVNQVNHVKIDIQNKWIFRQIINFACWCPASMWPQVSCINYLFACPANV